MTDENCSTSGSGEYSYERYANESTNYDTQIVKQLTNDPYFTGNRKIIHDLLFDEVYYRTGPGFCNKEGPSDNNIWMRKTLIVWLRDVAEHKGCEPDVLGLTVLLIDRYLNSCCITKENYQLAGATCFFVASKIKETIPVSAERMVQYTDNCITFQDLMESEIQLLVILNFDLNAVSPVDFILPMVDHLNLSQVIREPIRHSAIDIFLKCIHCVALCDYIPSRIAAACLLAASDSLYSNDIELFTQILNRLRSILSTDKDVVDHCYECIQICLAEISAEREAPNNTSEKIEEKSATTNQTTPTDLRDVRF